MKILKNGDNSRSSAQAQAPGPRWPRLRASGAKYALGLLVTGALVWAAPGCGSQASVAETDTETGQLELGSSPEANHLSFVTKRPTLGQAFAQRGARLVAPGALSTSLEPKSYTLSGEVELSFSTRVNGVQSEHAWRVEQGHAQREVAPGVSEQVVALANGSQTSWTIAQRPEKFSAEIIVGEDTALLSVDGEGLWFDAGSTEKAVKVSHASWIDAEGRHTEVRGSYVGGRVIYRVPESVLAESSYPAVLDPIVSAEFFVAPALDADAYGAGIPSKILERPNGDVLYLSAATLEVRGVDPKDNKLKLAFVGTALFANPYIIRAVDIVMLGADLAFAWIESGSVQVRRLDLTTLDWKDAAPIAATDILTNQPGDSLAINANASRLLVTWADEVAYGVSGVDVGYALFDTTSLVKVGGGFLKTSSTAKDDIPTEVVVDDAGALGVLAGGGAGSTYSTSRLFTLDAAGVPVGVFDLPVATSAGDVEGLSVERKGSGAATLQRERR